MLIGAVASINDLPVYNRHFQNERLNFYGADGKDIFRQDDDVREQIGLDRAFDVFSPSAYAALTV